MAGVLQAQVESVLNPLLSRRAFSRKEIVGNDPFLDEVVPSRKSFRFWCKTSRIRDFPDEPNAPFQVTFFLKPSREELKRIRGRSGHYTYQYPIYSSAYSVLTHETAPNPLHKPNLCWGRAFFVPLPDHRLQMLVYPLQKTEYASKGHRTRDVLQAVSGETREFTFLGLSRIIQKRLNAVPGLAVDVHTIAPEELDFFIHDAHRTTRNRLYGLHSKLRNGHRPGNAVLPVYHHDKGPIFPSFKSIHLFRK
ncbi:MAG: hypothetical protein HY917_03675 [Candidatus Diapherotrites archaeon]|nr:hypothetical protein [Candidatus Diapherotrites archaeon]